MALAAAPSASANEVWNQSVGRSGPAAACPTSTQAELAQGWTQWTGSWAYWPNLGKGGHVCNRSIVWAQSPSGEGGVGCVLAQDDLPTYPALSVDFGDSKTANGFFFGAGCAGPLTAGVKWAYAGDEAAALTLCGGSYDVADPRGRDHGGDPNVWRCTTGD